MADPLKDMEERYRGVILSPLRKKYDQYEVFQVGLIYQVRLYND